MRITISSESPTIAHLHHGIFLIAELHLRIASEKLKSEKVGLESRLVRPLDFPVESQATPANFIKSWLDCFSEVPSEVKIDFLAHIAPPQRLPLYSKLQESFIENFGNLRIEPYGQVNIVSPARQPVADAPARGFSDRVVSSDSSSDEEEEIAGAKFTITLKYWQNSGEIERVGRIKQNRFSEKSEKWVLDVDESKKTLKIERAGEVLKIVEVDKENGIFSISYSDADEDDLGEVYLNSDTETSDMIEDGRVVFYALSNALRSDKAQDAVISSESDKVEKVEFARKLIIVASQAVRNYPVSQATSETRMPVVASSSSIGGGMPPRDLTGTRSFLGSPVVPDPSFEADEYCGIAELFAEKEESGNSLS